MYGQYKQQHQILFHDRAHHTVDRHPMFWSTVSTLATLVTSGPRAVLARLLSTALAEHFEVNQDEIESNLLRDAKVVLKNAKLRPRKFRSGGGTGGAILTSGGVVERVEFSWKWSVGSGSGKGNNDKNGGNAPPGRWVQDAKLTIDGLKFHAAVEKWDEADESTRLECLQLTESEGSGIAAPPRMDDAQVQENESYLERCLQQIIDHLTLRVTDFEFALDPKCGGSGVVIGGTDLELVTISSEHTHTATKDGGAVKGVGEVGDEDMHVPLRQTIRFGSFFADVVKRAAATATCSTQDSDGSDGGNSGGSGGAMTKRRFQLLEPFSYVADVHRISGKRFVGGIGAGLELTGRSIISPLGGASNGDKAEAQEGGEVTFHAESEQMTALCKLGAMFAPPPQEGEGDNDGHQNNNRSGSGAESDESFYSCDEDNGANADAAHSSTELEPKVDAAATIEGKTQDGGSEADIDLDANGPRSSSTGSSHQSQSASVASILSLPLPSLSLILPDGVKITIPAGVTVTYRMDGRVFNVRGTSGILLDDAPIVSLGDKSSSVVGNDGAKAIDDDGSIGRWTVDLVKRSAVLECVPSDSSSDDNDNDGCTTATITLRKEPIRRLFASIAKLITNRSAIELSETMMSASSTNIAVKWEEDVVGEPFSFACHGSIRLRMEGGNAPEEDWFESTLHSPSAVVSADPSAGGNYALSALRTDRLDIGPFSGGRMKLTVPVVALSEDGKTLRVSGDVSAEAESVDTLTSLGKFLVSYVFLADVLRTDTLTPAPTTGHTLPFGIKVPGVTAKLEEHGATLTAKSLAVQTDLGLTCDSLRAEDIIGHVVDARGIKVASDMRAMVDSITECAVPGVARLASPTSAIQAIFRQGSLRVQLPSVHVVVAQTSTAPNATQLTEPDDSTAEMGIPFPVNLVMKELIVEKALGGYAAIRLEGINACAKEDGDNICVWTQGNTNMTVERPSSNEWVKASVQPFSVTLSKSGSTGIDALSVVKCAGITFGPTSFGTITAQLPSLVCLPQSDGLRISASVEVKAQSMDVVDQLKEFATRLASEDGDPSKQEMSPKPDEVQSLPFPVNVSEVKVEVQDRNLRAILAEVNVDRSLQVRIGVVSAKDGESGAHFSASKVSATVFPAMMATVETIDALRVPDVFELAEVVSNVKMEYKDGSAKVDLESLGVVLDSSALSPAAVPRHEGDVAGQQESVVVPFPVRVAIAEFVVVAKAARGDSFLLRLSNLDVSAETEDGLLVVQTKTSVGARLESSGSGQWIEASCSPCKGLLCPSEGKVFELKCAQGIAIGPSSVGTLSGRVPSIVMERNAGIFNIAGAVDLTVKSSQVLESLHSFFEDVSQLYPGSSGTTAQEQHDEPSSYGALVDEIKCTILDEKAMARATTIFATETEVACKSVWVTHGGETSASLLGLKASPHRKLLEIESIFTAEISGLAKIDKPIQNIKIAFRDGSLEIESESLGIVLLKGPSNKAAGVDDTATFNPPNVPFPVAARLGGVTISAEKDNSSSISMRNLHVEAMPMGDVLSIRLISTASIRLEDSQSRWLEASMNPFAIKLEECMGEMAISSLNFAGAAVGPSSLGHVHINIPGAVVAEVERNAPVAVRSTVGRSLSAAANHVAFEAQSADLCQQLQIMAMQVMEDLLPASEPSTEIPLPFTVSELNVSVLDEKAFAVFSGIAASGTNVYCDAIQLVKSSGLSATATRAQLAGVLDPCKRLDIEMINSASIPGVGVLSNPIANTSIVYDGKSISINLSSLDLATVNDEKSAQNSSDGFSLPLQINAHSQTVRIRSSGASDDDALVVNNVAVLFKPYDAVSGSSFINVEAKFSEAQHKLFSMRDFEASAAMLPSRPDEIHKLKVALREPRITAGFSSVDWNHILGGGDNSDRKQVFKTPHARVGALKVRISYKGKIVSAKETALNLPPFDGNATTTSEDIINHYSRNVLNRATGILVNTEILGSNVLDVSMQSVGMLATEATVAGAAVGSVIGVSAIDSVKAAVKSGKNARGAGSDDAYKFGDFTRGSVRGLKNAVKAGAEKRNVNRSHYVPGDLTVGTLSAVGSYMGNNKKKLGAAGAGGAGAMIGMAVLAGPLAPVGLVAGSLLGAKAASAALGEDTKKESSSVEEETAQWTAHVDPSSGKTYYYNGKTTTWENPTELNGNGGGGVVPVVDHIYGTPVQQTQGQGVQTESQQHAGSSGDFDLLGFDESPTSAGRGMRCENAMSPQQGNLSGLQQPPMQADSFPVSSAHPVMQSAARSSPHNQPPTSGSSSRAAPQQEQGGQHREGYRFGDFTRNIVSKGKKKGGRDGNSKYKFGDFTRGLLG